MDRTLGFIRGIIILLLFFGAFVWCLWRSVRKSNDPARTLFRWVMSCILVVGGLITIVHFGGDGDTSGQLVALVATLGFAFMLGIIWVPAMASRVGDWFGNLYTGGGTPADPTPFYSVAQAMRKKARPDDAMREIRKQLQRFPNDATGHLLLAEIQAEDFNDLPSAERTLEDFCAQPGHSAPHIAEAFNRIADWQMKLAQDPVAARLALQRIIDLLPGTDQAQVAAQRLAHLGDDRALEAVRDRKPIHLPHGADNIGLMKDSSVLQRPEEDFEATAARLVAHLTEHPLDPEAREKLAMIYSEHYQRLDLAADQLNQLTESPNQPPNSVARWLNLLADMQLKHGADYETVRETLQRIADRFSGFAPAELAQQRIEHLRLELKAKEAPHVVKLGTYDQNIGLKGRTPTRRDGPGSR